MHLIPTLLFSSLVSQAVPDEGALLAAVPEGAFALVHVADPSALRSRAEQNDWMRVYGSPEGESALLLLAQEYETATGTDFDGLLDVALELHGEALLFVTGQVAGFMTEPPADRAALAAVLDGWLTEGGRTTFEVAGGSVQLAAWPEISDGSTHSPGQFLAFLDHPLALGLYSGDSAEVVMETLTDSLVGLLAGERRAPVVEGFLGAGGGTSPGIEAFVDFTPFVALAESTLRDAVSGVLPDPTGLLGLEQGTWLFATADVSPGIRVEVNATLRIPEGTLAARLADSFEPLPLSLPPDLPQGTWNVWALDWNLSRFYATARAGLEAEEGDGMEVVDQGLEVAQALTGVDPVADVMQQLAGLFALYHVLDSGESAQTVEGGFGLLVGLLDGEQFLDAFEALLGAGAIGVDAIELEGAETYLIGSSRFMGSDAAEMAALEGFDGGLSILPERLLASLSRATLVRGLRALGRVEGAGLGYGSLLQAAFDENAGAFAFGYTELAQLRTVAYFEAGMPAGEESDPFDSQLILAAKRNASAIELRVYTR